MKLTKPAPQPKVEQVKPKVEEIKPKAEQVNKDDKTDKNEEEEEIFSAKNLLKGFVRNFDDYRKYFMICFRCWKDLENSE